MHNPRRSQMNRLAQPVNLNIHFSQFYKKVKHTYTLS